MTEANANALLLRMKEGIKQVAGAEKAEEFFEKFPLSKSAELDKKFTWAESICQYLQDNFTTEETRSIRHQCFCTDAKKAAADMRDYMAKTDSIEAFVKLFNEKTKYGWMEYVNEHSIIFCYPECYCSCVKRVDKPLPKEWCYCTEGYAMNMFRQVVNSEVKAELLESVKLGGKRCAVKLEW